MKTHIFVGRLNLSTEIFQENKNKLPYFCPKAKFTKGNKCSPHTIKPPYNSQYYIETSRFSTNSSISKENKVLLRKKL